MINKSDISQMSPLVWAYMGDAVYEKFIREYVIRQGLCKNGLLHKITKDHTLVNLLVSTGELTPEQAKFHPRKNLLTRALGANDPIEIDIFDVDTNVSGLFLCSDGLTNMIADDQIEKVLNNKSSIEEQVEKLIKKSNMRGGTDNISIAYLKKESGDL